MIFQAARLLAFLLLGIPLASAQTQSEALALMNRAVQASQHTAYLGTFVYQSGSSVETSRIAHYVDADGNSIERLEVLDGSPREVVRINDEVRCYLPKEKVVIEDRRGSRKTFPSLLPQSVGALTDFYSVSKGPSGRVAGFSAESVLLQPKDGFRYGYVFWIEAKSGLLLKARMVNERGEAIEQFAFAQLQIGLPLTRDDVRSRLASLSEGWTVHSANTTSGQNVDVGWAVSNDVPGFRQVAGMKRSLGPDRPDMVHMVFSDGLAAISVFIEPFRKEDGSFTGPMKHGAVNVFKRRVAGYVVTALGEVPPHSLQRMAEGVEQKR
ncbi:MAG: MucB/RseB C-terminal domain-containing protein [Gammaproteobacteria bacterium]|jgi:sigma-E factor negative regulatory protein RseB|nr:MucB/RseB C-terminal domain-containing protein [Gammaproteobacteria bacterium]MBU0773107.1 MucB/RseB C-terminal domain-containing protein [Gammaproteobacteria bacterium]MBU0855745.1 MucB/RseB C-terminal domain-containing protein [Gammaproteobacteria bacterium]MBU1846986.1 MucB/RseB C-terminal domain-containing protein [Gammaproteobacteria bacterium]